MTVLAQKQERPRRCEIRKMQVKQNQSKAIGLTLKEGTSERFLV